MFIAIAGAMAFKIMVEIDTGHHFGFIIALGKYDAQVLVLLLRIAFERVGGAGFCVYFGLAVIDGTVLHDILHFLLCNMPAIHAALRMFGVFEVAVSPVEAMVAVYVVGHRGPAGRPAGTHRQRQYGQYGY